jgi:hydroxymethylbilane synthase
MNQRLEGGCQVPIACYAVLEGNDRIWLRGLVGSPDGAEVLMADMRGDCEEAQSLGVSLAERLLEMGAGRILESVYQTHA